MDGVVLVGLDERGFAESEAAGAQHAGVGGGCALVNAAFVEGLHYEEEIELDGGAILGKVEGDEVGEVIGVATAVAGEFFDVSVVVAEERVLDGGRVTTDSVGLDASADFVHGFLEKFLCRDRDSKGFTGCCGSKTVWALGLGAKSSWIRS